jgi:hypothetical protein
LKLCLDELKVRALHSNGIAMFPPESNPKEIVIEELAPLGV